MLNTDLLAESIRQSGKSNKFLAEKMGISTTGFYMKRRGERPFKSTEINILCDELTLTKSELVKIFFA